MLKSHSCLWRRIQALDVSTTNPPPSCRLASPLCRPNVSRLLSTSHVVHAKPRERFEVDQVVRGGKDAWKKSAVAANQMIRERRTLRKEQPRRDDETAPMAWDFGKRDPSMTNSEWDRRKRELQYLRDPLELALFVKQELRKGKAKEMLQLVRMASHSMQCIVSWNHLLDHLLAVGRISDALKVYNEVRLASAKKMVKC